MSQRTNLAFSVLHHSSDWGISHSGRISYIHYIRIKIYDGHLHDLLGRGLCYQTDEVQLLQ